MTPHKLTDNHSSRALGNCVLACATFVAVKQYGIRVVFSVRERKRTKMTSSPRQQKNTSPDGSECTQLLQLLAKNPSAALKVFKFTSPNDEKPPVQSYKGRRPKFTPGINYESSPYSPPATQHSKVRIYCLPPKFNSSRTIRETLQKPKKLDSAILLSKEEIELKSKCVDDLGNFIFDAILPAVYWKVQQDCAEMTIRQNFPS